MLRLEVYRAPEQISTAATTEKPNNLQLLAVWPKPATGSAIFPAAPTASVTPAETEYTITDGRGTLGTNTASDLAEGGTGYKKKA